MFDICRWMLDLDIGVGMRTAAIAQQQRIALGMITCLFGAACDPYQAAIGVLRLPCRDPLGHDSAAGIASDMDHLGAGVSLLFTLGHRYRVKFTDRVITAQDTTGILPGNRGTGLDLGPGYVRTVTAAVTALGDKIVDAATTLFIPGIPVLHGRILDGRIAEGDQLHHGRVQLVFVALRGGTAFQVTDITTLIGNDQGPLELSGLGFVDTKIGRQLHRTTHVGRNVDEGAITEHRGIERGKEVIGMRYHAGEVFLHQFRVVLQGFRHGAENDACLMQFFAKGGSYRDTVEDRIHGDAGQRLLLFQRDSQLVVGFENFRIDLIQALWTILLLGR